MNKIQNILYSLCLLLFMFACSQEEEIEKFPTVINKYDPDKPASVDEILPVRGIIDQTFIVNGNFPGDLSDMKVYFGKKRAIITASDGISITGLVPKQPEGLNQISVVLGNDSLVPAIKFKYKQSRSVKTIAGKLGEDKWLEDADYSGAALDAVTFGDVAYVATVAGQNADNIILVRSGWGTTKPYLLSQDDNKVQVLAQPTTIAAPAVPSTRDKFYVTNFFAADRKIYIYSKENNWAYVGAGVTVKQSDLPGAKVCSMAFGEDDNWLYLMDSEGRIAEVDLNSKTYKVYASAAKKPWNIDANNYGGEIVGELPTEFGDWQDSYIVYSNYHACFFASFANQAAIYKLEKNDDNTWTSSVYAGNNGQGIETGHRLDDARLNHPHGMVVNSDGELFVVNKGSCPWCGDGQVILKIYGDMVELVAGNPSSNSPLTNGDPLESTFDYPRNIVLDSDGNYIIAGGEDRTVRKLSIE